MCIFMTGTGSLSKFPQLSYLLSLKISNGCHIPFVFFLPHHVKSLFSQFPLNMLYPLLPFSLVCSIPLSLLCLSTRRALDSSMSQLHLPFHGGHKSLFSSWLISISFIVLPFFFFSLQKKLFCSHLFHSFNL